MPKLPDFQSLGRRPSVQSGRPLSSVDLSGEGEGMAALGRSIGNAGGSLISIAEREKATQESLEDASYRSTRLVNKLKLDERRDNTSDPAELNKIAEGYKLNDEQSASVIRDPNRRQKVMLEHAPAQEQSRIAVRNRQFAIEKDNYTAAKAQELETLADKGHRSKDDAERKEVVETAGALIKSFVDKGYWDAAQAQAFRAKWERRYREGGLALLTPRERARAMREPGEGIEAVAASGRAVDFDKINPAVRAGLKAAGGYYGEALEVTYGSEGGHAKGSQHYHVDENGNSAANAVDIRVRNMSKQDRARAVESLIAAGFTGIHEDADHIHADMRGGKIWRGNVTTPEVAAVMDNLGFTSGGEPGQVNRSSRPPVDRRGSYLAQGLPYARRRELLAEAEAEMAADRSAMDKQRRAAAADLSSVIAADLASVEERGTGVAEARLNRAKVAEVAGEEAAAAWEAQRARAKQIHGVMDGIDTLPEGEAYARLVDLEPKAGSVDFVEETATYNRAKKKVDDFVRARNADPANAVKDFPAVREARQNAQYDEKDGIRSIKPESAQAIIRARLAMQSHLAIPEPMAVTRGEAEVIARQLRMINENDPSGLERFNRSLTATYGEYADEVLASTLQHARVRAELSVEVTKILRDVMAGANPKPADMKRVEQLIDNQTIASVLGQPLPDLPRELNPPGIKGKMNRNAAATMRQAEQVESRRAAAGSGATPTQDDVRFLDANPDKSWMIDDKYGQPGLGEKMLKDLRRRVAEHRLTAAGASP